MSGKLTSKEFIQKAILKHGDKYDYSKVEYINTRLKICIICHDHGEFWQIPSQHLYGYGCSKCRGFINISSVARFTERVIKIHGDKYDYSKVNHIDKKDKITIICKEHGCFEQYYFNHLKGNGCRKCSLEINSAKAIFTTEEFVEKANEIHGNKYEYSKVKYSGCNIKVEIVCKNHGSFSQTPHNHLAGRGCKKCKQVNNITFIKRATRIHRLKYDYSKVNVQNGDDKIIIICSRHGEFKQRASSHLSGCGCPKCQTSKGEDKIREWLDKNDIAFEEQKKFKDCRDKYVLRFDFYLPDFNLCIEFDGIQHFKPYSFDSDKSDISKVKNLSNVQKKDNIKNEFCKNNGINLLRIPYFEGNNINDILILNLKE